MFANHCAYDSLQGDELSTGAFSLAAGGEMILNGRCINRIV